MNYRNCKILVASHKPCAIPTDSIYLPMHVGSIGKASIPGFTRDDSGDNISEKNPIYSELTGLYWAWKNLDCDYLGLVHYRRFFTVRPRRERKMCMQAVLNVEELELLLDKYRILAPQKRYYYIENIYSHYAHTFDGAQLDIARQIIYSDYPEYGDPFDQIMKQRNAYIYNMFIMPKTLSDAYCCWLFDILRKLEKKVETTGMSDFEKRYLGRIGERLFNVWIKKQVMENNIKERDIGEIPVLYTEKINWTRKAYSFLAAKFLKRKYKESF